MLKDRKIKGSKSEDVAAVCVLVVFVVFFSLMMGPALDRQFAVWDAQEANFKASLAVRP